MFVLFISDNLTRNGMRMFVCQGKMWHIRSLKSRVPENVFDKLLFQTKKYLLEFKHFTQNQRSKRSIRNQSLGLFDEVLFLPTSSEYRYSRDIFDDNNDYFPQHVYGVFDDNLSSHLNKLVASDDFLNDLSPEISLESTYKDSSKQRLHQNRGSKEKKTDFMVEKAFPFAFVDSLQSDVEKSLQKSLDVLDLHGIDNDIANPTDKDDLEELIPINQHRKHTEIALTANKHRNSLKDEPMTFQKEFEKTNKHQNTALDDMLNFFNNLETDKFSENKDKFSLNILPTPVRPIDVLEDNQDNADVISNIRTVMLLPKDIVNSELAQNWNMTKELNASVQDINVKNHKLETEEENLFTSVMWLKERIEELLHENSPINQEDLLKQMKTIIHEATYSAVKAMVKDVR